MSALLTIGLGALASDSKNRSDEAQGAAPTQTPVCGIPGAPACPLQAWMRSNLGTPLATNNMAALAKGLERTARLAPDPEWRSWKTFASRGAEAAKKGDVSAIRAACKGCHDTWREQYRAKFRSRPVPR